MWCYKSNQAILIKKSSSRGMDVSEIYLHCYEGGSETAQPQVFSFPHLLARLRRSLPGQQHHCHYCRFDPEVFFYKECF